MTMTDLSLSATKAPTSAFSDTEIEFLTTQRLLGRLATVGASGQPHVVPVGWSYNTDLDTIDIAGSQVENTKKFRDAATNPLVAFVVDDVLPPWRPRCIEIRGTAEAINPADGPALIRITATKVVSWGVEER